MHFMRCSSISLPKELAGREEGRIKLEGYSRICGRDTNIYESYIENAINILLM